MQDNDNEIVKDKISYYFKNKLKVHIKLKPVGFIDGEFNSNLQDDIFYWVLDYNGMIKKRVFLSEIFDIKDFQAIERGGERKDGND